MPFVWKKERKKNWKSPLTTPIWHKKTKSQRKNKFVFFFRYLELFLFAMENHFKNLLQIFLNTTESKSLILVAKTEIGFANFVFLQTFFEKRKTITKYRHTYAIWIVIMLDSFEKWKKQENQNKKHKITLNDIWALLIIVYLVKKKRNKNKKRT